MDKECKNCGAVFFCKDKRKVFCTRSCSAQYNNSKRIPPSEEQKTKISDSLKKYFIENPDKIRKGEEASQAVGNSTKGKFKNEITSILETSSRTTSKILKRLDLSCSICGWKEGSLDIHHINGRKIPNANQHENLTVLCPNCHRLTHEGKIGKDRLINLVSLLPNNWKEVYFG
jgi:5-methylcytosine-specific restriction endonuclease McrA